MNPLGIHALVWAGGWSHEECEHAVRSTREAGYDILEIPALDPASIDIPHTKAVLAGHGVRGVCSLGLDLDADISSPDPDVVARGQARLADALAVVTGIGGDYLGGAVFSALAKYDRPLDPRGRENMIAGLRTLAREAAGHGVTVGLEPVNRYESNAINTVADALAVIDEVGEPNVVVHLDVYHANIEETDFVSPVREAGSRLGYVHIGESHRGYLGTGTIDFPAFFGALRDTGYSGPVTFESFSRAVVSADLSDRLAVWRDLWSDGMDLATHARRFITDALTG
ncbi:sugar phosphate isomerase/epimerase [Pseudonocardia sp. MH-G8]|uniref:sugar phosphate isomerase/epimerase family protein n=1 Tax=Pseudonocardia sp. MH-G8 TaxID=1854588 RepID=UPI000BA0E655|nr:sugar phosphate isomerase/epimerase [Pseudonocardia sp. MH-G8]OZM82206.1 epimerase [Pseudonocardia sp. MH-G8]